jgi:hypothetical protein
MKQRGITEAQVRGAILKAQIRAPTADGKKTRARFHMAGRVLEVIYAETPSRIVVVTVVWSRTSSE